MEDILSFDEFKKLINEKKENQSYSYGCIMGFFGSPIKKIKIDKEDLYDNDENEYGLELDSEAHVTLLYGLEDDKIKEENIIDLLSMIECPEVETKQISLFENKDYDVVKFDIESKYLNLLNKMLTSMFPFKSDYPDYHAHSTIAYCLPGKGKKYKEMYKEVLSKKIKYWVYSKADGKKIKITPGKGSEIIRKEKSVKESIMTEEELINYSKDVQICTFNNPKYIKDYDNKIKTDKKAVIHEDRSYFYKGYNIKLMPHTKFNGSYYVSVYKDNNYLGGLRGPVPLKECIQWAENLVNNKIN